MAQDARSGAAAGQFDFYVLALSWSPSYCAAEGADANRQQCGPGRDFGFVVHGLWPQYERGYPQYCPTRQPSRVPDALGRGYLDIMPSMGLIGSEWRKHGVCTGLTQADYLALTRRAFERVKIPPALSAPDAPQMLSPAAIEAAFVAANPGLTAGAMATACDARRFREVRICLTLELTFRTCPEVDADGCRIPRADVPPVR
jgi:ribonuclease T2